MSDATRKSVYFCAGLWMKNDDAQRKNAFSPLFQVPVVHRWHLRSLSNRRSHDRSLQVSDFQYTSVSSSAESLKKAHGTVPSRLDFPVRSSHRMRSARKIVKRQSKSEPMESIPHQTSVVSKDAGMIPKRHPDEQRGLSVGRRKHVVHKAFIEKGSLTVIATTQQRKVFNIGSTVHSSH